MIRIYKWRGPYVRCKSRFASDIPGNESEISVNYCKRVCKQCNLWQKKRREK